jgi:hypothetical protein
MQVKETKNYKEFTLIDVNNGHNMSNRPIDMNKIARMRPIIKANNRTNTWEIIVNSKEVSKERYGTDGTKYAIVDGQHRFVTCQLEELPFWYKVDDTINLQDIPKAHSMNTGWNLKMQLDHHASNKNCENQNEYKKFKGYMEKNGLPPSVTLVVLYGSRGRGAIREFANGNFIVKREWSFANDFADAVHDIGKFIPFNKHSRFVEAMLIAFGHEEYDHKRMMNKVEFNANRIRRCADTKMHLEQLEEIYNWKSNNKVRLNLLRDMDLM